MRGAIVGALGASWTWGPAPKEAASVEAAPRLPGRRVGITRSRFRSVTLPSRAAPQGC
jgi:hypothetical protein